MHYYCLFAKINCEIVLVFLQYLISNKEISVPLSKFIEIRQFLSLSLAEVRS